MACVEMIIQNVVSRNKLESKVRGQVIISEDTRDGKSKIKEKFGIM